jgi:hypothetical protein
VTKTKKHVLDNLNIKTDDAFWDRAMAMDIKTWNSVLKKRRELKIFLVSKNLSNVSRPAEF